MPRDLRRREFLGAGLAAVGSYLIASTARGRGWDPPPLVRPWPDWAAVPSTTPILRIPAVSPTVSIGGLPFHPKWLGDSFSGGGFPFHTPEAPPRWAALDEHVDVAIVGGGLSGLATAHEMRDRDFVLFDLRDRFGGNAIGEEWKRIPYSLGSAYFMVPDDGDALDRLYTSLGVYEAARIDEGSGFRIEYGDVLLDDLCADCTQEERLAFERYRAAVLHYANNAYPYLPWIDAASEAVVRSLDGQTFHEAVTAACAGPVPALLAKAIQAYCYSSFGVGWDELSAAAGWNFVAAEEFGRIVLPGGNAGFATMLWDSLAALPPRANGRARLRGNCMVTAMRLDRHGVALSYRGPGGEPRTLGANQVVYAGSKHIFPHLVEGLAAIDPAKYEATQRVHTVGYIVANVLLNRPVHPEFYDIFSIHDDQFPMGDEAFEQDRRITDCLDGSFAYATAHPQGDVLTLYWPLPWHTARFTIIDDASLTTYATLAAPQIRRLLALVGMSASDINSIRMARWGHAMPWAPPGTYSDELCAELRRPLADRIWFANQDNWLLPAVETCLTEAMWVAKHLPRS